MTVDLAALVLAAGQGTRLRPLTFLHPKPLCPMGDTTMLDLALARVGTSVEPDAIAVNASHLAPQIQQYLGDRVHISYELPKALGTAGAVGKLRDWLGGRDVLIANGDVVLDPEPDLDDFVAGWDRERPRLLVVSDPDRADFDGGWRFAGVSLLPGATAARLKAEPSGLYEAVWRDADVDLVPTDCRYVDCADPSSYLAANLMLSGGESIVGAGATVEGTIERCVVWPGAKVDAGEHLVETIRARHRHGHMVTVPAPQ
ncbi:MAG: NTP transferase domain-containing protein [Frankiaceae bacterium]|nr:NTP transferase domain-containing protein [Frankiaceae bacterium]